MRFGLFHILIRREPIMGINWSQEQPAPKALWNIVHSNFPQTRNLGIYNTDADDHSEGRALDIGLLVVRSEESAIAWGLIEDVLKPKQSEIGWSYFIWDQWIWYPDTRGQQRGGFKGDHTNHIHVSWSRDTSQRNAFPETALAVSALLRKIYAAVEDDARGVSESRPYCR
jgi:hypothetical protein